MGLWYSKDSGFELIAYADADHAGCNDDCKSTSGGIQFLGDKLVSWSSKKQDCTAMSSAEAEYISLSTCCAQEHVEKGTIELYFVETEYQLANLFTKSLPKERFELLVHKIVFHMAQHVIPAAQLVPQYKPIGRCNNYAVLQSIPCSPECKIVGLILLDHYTLQLPVETPENPFVAPANIHTIEAFMNKVGYQGVVDKKFPNIPKRIDEDYHSIKDDVTLVSVYTTGNVSVRGMLIPDAFLTAEIRETDDFKEYEMVSPTVFAGPQEMKKRKQTAGVSISPRKIIKQKKQSTPSILPPGDDRERDAIAEATLLSLTLHKTALLAEAQENIAKVQEKLDEEEIDKMVKGSTDDESYASEFANSILNNEGAEVDDTGSKIEPVSQKENPERVSDDDETEKENEVEQDMEERETKEDTIVPELPVAKTNEMLKKEMPHLVKLAVNKDREVSPVDISGMVSKEFAAHGPKLIEELFHKHMQNTTLDLYPKTSSSTASTSSADLQQQLFQNMKAKPQDQAADPEVWEILKAKFENP
ncbi:hypothetical protein Tco_0066752 [Tanacetum coccineum]